MANLTTNCQPPVYSSNQEHKLGREGKAGVDLIVCVRVGGGRALRAEAPPPFTVGVYLAICYEL